MIIILPIYITMFILTYFLIGLLNALLLDEDMAMPTSLFSIFWFLAPMTVTIWLLLANDVFIKIITKIDEWPTKLFRKWFK